FDLLDDVGLGCPFRIYPEDSRRLGCTGASDCQLSPVAYRYVLGLDGTPDIAFFYLVAHQDVTFRVHDFYSAVSIHHKGFIVGTVFLGLLGHEANVWHRAHRGWVKCAIS